MFALSNTVLHGDGNKIVDAGLAVQVHYTLIGMKGDRSFLKEGATCSSGRSA
jgi:hypothetical protein